MATATMAHTARKRPATDRPEGAGPLRRCVATGVVQAKDGLVRCVVGPDGTVVPDVAERLPGRGLWIAARRDIVAGAAAGKGFARAARQAVRLPHGDGEGLADQIERQLVSRCIDLIGLARRAGQAVCGQDRVREWLRQGRCGRGAVMLVAADGAEDGVEKLARLAGHTAPEADRVVVLTAAELGQAFGRERVVHAAVAPGRLAGEIGREAMRLGGFRAPPMGNRE